MGSRTAVAVLSFVIFQTYCNLSAAFVTPCSIVNAAKLGLPSGRLYASSESRKGDSGQTFQFVVTYEGRSCEVDAYPDETILNAMERNCVMDKLCLPNMPADCRRGNCMTCAGRILTGRGGDDEKEQLLNVKGSKKCDKDTQLVQRGEDGLAPYASGILQSSDYILLCSSFVTGDGVRIELGENSRLWEEMYQTRFVDEEAEKTKHETVAKLLRLRAESDVPRWTAETEEVLEKTEE
jgi:ferredoxin